MSLSAAFAFERYLFFSVFSEGNLDTKSRCLYRKSERVHFWSVSRVRELCSELALHGVMTRPRPYVRTSNAYGAVGHLSATGRPSTHDRTWCQGNVRHCHDALRYRHQNISLRMRKIPRVGQQAHKGISATVEFLFFGYRRAIGNGDTGNLLNSPEVWSSFR